MKIPGQVDNSQFGCKVDNKYEAIADSDDPFEALERLESGQLPKKDPSLGQEKSKGKSSPEKQTVNSSGSARKAADPKKEAVGTNRPQSTAAVGKLQIADAKTHQVERTNNQRPKSAVEKSHEQRRPRGGVSARGNLLPQQAGVVGLMVTDAGAVVHVQGAIHEDRSGTAENSDGFQSQRSGSSAYRGRRGGFRGAGFGPTSAGGAYRQQRGGLTAPRFQAAPSAANNELETTGDVQAAGEIGGETEERLERGFEKRHRPYHYGGYGHLGPRGGARRGAPSYGSFEDGTGRKRAFDRHSGSDMTGVKAVEKKDGAGQHNWGTVQDDLAGQTEGAEGAQPESGEKRAGVEGAVKEAKAGEAWTDLVNADESAKAAEGASGEGTQQDKMYILDDWKAKEEKERFRVPEFNVRKPNEGVDASSKWGGFVLKKREDEIQQATEGDEDTENLAQAGESTDDMKRKNKQRVAIPVMFANTGHGRGSYGSGRGGARGGGEFRDRGNQRGGYDRPRGDRAGYRSNNHGVNRGDRGAAGTQVGAPQLTIDEFPSLNKQANA